MISTVGQVVNAKADERFIRRKEAVRLVQSMCARLPVHVAVRGVVTVAIRRG
jgi:hypothetical protein